ncbi:MAG: alpha/beta fold hydrolase [Rhodothermales bacterium]|nr:alpha/beta fold hydrolase [Rhodothermales bacterium]MBO6780604.1 alpha/beta fold hydrolase [Rhodothermales bacterium]
MSSGPSGGPPVLILHGWGSSAAVMQGFAQSLEDRYRVLNVDLPGHGLAAAPPESMDMEAHAEAVAGHLVGPAHVIGHSNGGRIALYMAGSDRYAHLIRSLTLISPSGVRRPRTAAYHVRRTVATVLKAPFRPLPTFLREPGLDWLRHSLVWRLLGSSDYRKLEGPMRETFVQLVNTYVEERLDRIAAPTLLFWGDADQAILKAQIDVLMAGIPEIGLVTLEGAGHYGFLDQPATVYAGTRHFLDQLEETA